MRPTIDLRNNEGPPPPKACLEGFLVQASDLMNRYASPAPLEAAFADYIGTKPDCVLATTGGDDAIDRAMRTLLEPDQEILFPVPTFEMIPAYARMARATLAPLKYDWGRLPHDEILGRMTERTGMVVLISPDNPTGHAFAIAEIERLADALPEDVTLLLDAAYLDYADENYTLTMLRRSQVVMIRSMSKAWGLAGMRIGFVVGCSERVGAIRNSGGPYPLTGPSIEIALRCLQSGRDSLLTHITQTRNWRPVLVRMLQKAGGTPCPSQANFVLAAFPDAAWVARGLAAQGVRVRTFDHLPDHVRITVPRNEDEMAVLDRALECLSFDMSTDGACPDAVLFDMDGVLADVRHSYRETIAQTCASFGVSVGQEAISAVKRAGDANDDWALTHGVLAEAGVETSLDAVTERFEEIYQGTPEVPGLRRFESLIPTREVLARLARSCRLGIVTGRPRVDAECFLQEQDIGTYFSAVICREDGPLKPDPTTVHRALEELDARTAWLLGDTPDDVMAACRAGVVPIGILAPGQNGNDRKLTRAALEAAGAARIVEASSDYGGLFNA